MSSDLFHEFLANEFPDYKQEETHNPIAIPSGLNNPFRYWLQFLPEEAIEAGVTVEDIWNHAIETSIDQLKLRAEAQARKNRPDESCEAIACTNILRALQSERIGKCDE